MNELEVLRLMRGAVIDYECQISVYERDRDFATSGQPGAKLAGRDAKIEYEQAGLCLNRAIELARRSFE